MPLRRAESVASTDAIRLVDPRTVRPNPENPRLIFRAQELDELAASIKAQGILVPLTVYQSSDGLVILDGERRWRCAVKLGLTHVPVIVQPEPTRLQNIMMMFAIHHQRQDWDPLPTAYKLRELEEEFTRRQDRSPTEAELAQLASMSRGEVRRLRKLLGLPEEYRVELMEELDRPRSEQRLTVDHVLEATKAASSARKRGLVSEPEEDQLRKAIIQKFKDGVVSNTVEPRKLARIARAVERQEVPVAVARRAVSRLIAEPAFTIEQAFQTSVEQVDFEHSTEQLVERLSARLDEHRDRGYEVGASLRESLHRLASDIKRILGN